MADITHNDPVVTESKLTEFYNDIKPFLGCPAYLTSEGNAEYYSTDEKVIGRWIDNKPLYQKVVYLNDNDPTTTWTSKNIPHNISNVDYISGYGFFQEAYDNNKSTFWLNTVSGNEYFRCTFNKTNITIGRSSNWVMQGYAWIILNYTKTTDSASTTIQEDPNEYSTDEKIIGKWIDNRPIYQKTISTGSLGTGTIEIAHGISNVDELIYSVGTAKRSDGYKFSFPTLHTNSNWDAFIHGINTTNIVLQIGSSFVGTYQLTDSTVTIQYTKTTD